MKSVARIGFLILACFLIWTYWPTSAPAPGPTSVSAQPAEKVPFFIKSRVKTLVADWKESELERIRPKSVGSSGGSSKRGSDSSAQSAGSGSSDGSTIDVDKRMKHLVYEIRDFLFSSKKLSEESLRATLQQAVVELGYERKDAEAVVGDILAKTGS